MLVSRPTRGEIEAMPSEFPARYSDRFPKSRKGHLCWWILQAQIAGVCCRLLNFNSLGN